VVLKITFCLLIKRRFHKGTVTDSHREVKKFTSGLTSTAIWTYTDEELGYPNIAVCTRDSYRTKQYVTTPGKLFLHFQPKQLSLSISALHRRWLAH
jgi:hypothetical protein